MKHPLAKSDEDASEEPEADEDELSAEELALEEQEGDAAEGSSGGEDEGEESAEAAMEPRGPKPAGVKPYGPVISSRKNNRIHLARALATRRGRRRENRFLVEGPKVVRELLAEGRIELILWKEGAEQRADVATLVDEAKAKHVEAFAVAPALFDELATTDTSQGVIAVAPLEWGDLEAALGPVPEAPLDSAPPRTLVVAAGIQDPGNLGTIVRSARFLGVAGVLCVAGTTDPWSPKVVRASAGALLANPPARVDTLAQLSELGRARGYKTVALVPRGGRALEEAPLPRRSLLLLGAEGPGLTSSAIDNADEKVTILPSDPGAESLNAAMAFALFAHAWRSAWARPAAPPTV